MSDETEKKNVAWMKLLYVLPLIIFLALGLIFQARLFDGKDRSEVPSALIGKIAPTFDLAGLEGDLEGFSTKNLISPLKGEAKLSLVNVWASWCAPCRAEHPMIIELAKDPRFQVIGLNYKDKADGARAFLEELGNPYDLIGADVKGRVGIDFGVYGVPETFVVSSEGRIVHKFIGPITPSRMRSELMPAIERALSSGS